MLTACPYCSFVTSCSDMAYRVPGQLYQNEYGLKSFVFRDVRPCSLVKVNWQAANIGVLVPCFMLVDFLFGFGFLINTEQKKSTRRNIRGSGCGLSCNHTQNCSTTSSCLSFHWSELGCIFLLCHGSR
jgi:hypothetical protein